jgi:hypothetical protein
VTQWRTQTVIALCQAVRQEQDYSALPILADALQDAEYPDETVLEQLRSNPNAIDAQRLVALIYSNRTAESVAWIEAFASELGSPNFYDEPLGPEMTYSTLMDAANRWIQNEFYTEMGANETYKDLYGKFPEFWGHYEAVTGMKPTSATSFFGCRC